MAITARRFGLPRRRVTWPTMKAISLRRRMPPVYRMLPVLQAWPIPTPLGQLPAYMQAVAEMGAMPTDEAGVRRLLLRIGHYQRLYIFANFGGGLDLYIQGPAATPMYIKFSSATSWDPTDWWAASDWRFVGLVPMAEWAEVARSRL